MSDEKIIVLVVDDDEDFIEQQKLFLTKMGCEVHTECSVEDGIKALETLHPSIAVIDLMMENPDGGFTLCHVIKKKYPEVPVIMVTAVASETGLEFDAPTSEERSWMKVDKLLTKPVRYEQLKGEIHRLLRK